MRVQRSSILKHGTENDVEKLGEESFWNKKRKAVVRTGNNGVARKRQKLMGSKNRVPRREKNNKTINNRKVAPEPKDDRSSIIRGESSSNGSDDNEEDRCLPDVQKHWDEARKQRIEIQSAKIAKKVAEGMKEELKKL